jgi:hypothetical protein
MRAWTACLPLLVTSALWAHPPSDLPSPLEEVELAAPRDGLGAKDLSIEINRASYARLQHLGSARVVGFPLPGGGREDLELAAVELLSPDAVFLVADARGVRETSAPEMRFFRGRIAADPDSLVSLTLFGGRISGFIRRGEDEWSFAPRSFSPDREGALDVHIWRAGDEAEAGGECAGTPPLPPGSEEQGLAAALVEEAFVSGIESTTLLKARIAVEGTVEWTNKHGGVTGAQAYTLNLMAQVSAIYETEVAVRIEVPFVVMNTAESDGYSGASNSATTMLGEMRSKWNGAPDRRAVFRTSAHLFSTYPSGGSGTSYVDVLCDNVPENQMSRDYGVSLLDGNSGSWEKRLVAHELGHSFSSPHTHCYSPEIDQCNNTEPGCYSGPIVQTTGTIMSYCSVKTYQFDVRTRDEKIRPGAEAAFPACMEVVGPPGDIRPENGSSLSVAPANLCGSAGLQNDDNTGNGSQGYTGTNQAAWVKRFTPSCYPFKLTRVDVQISDASVAVGRPIRVLVYRDPSGSGNPSNAVPVYSQDVTVQMVSGSAFNQYTLATPVLILSGDLYLGFLDLAADTATNYIMRYDSGHNGDSWCQMNTSAPSGYAAATSGSWMIRGNGGGVAAGSVALSWDLPCNDAEVPGQDFAIYQGTIGSWSGLQSLTCTTGRATTWLVEGPPANAFWLVVPQTSSNEGSYGRTSSGERAPAATACRQQAFATCG